LQIPSTNHPDKGPAVPPALKVRGMVVRYGSRTILDGVDMTVQPGEIRVILGGSGSGKSTLLKGVLGLTETAAGEVELLGRQLHTLSGTALRNHLQRIGVTFQNGALFGSLTVGENIALPLTEHRHLPGSIVQEMVRMKLDLVELGHAENLYPSELSGGMIKRAALARAMILDPDILFCDEPSAGLDPLTSAELDQLILKLRALFGMTVVVVTHELDSIETIADSIIMLGKTKVIAEGSRRDVRARKIPAVENFFARRIDPNEVRAPSVAELFGLTSSQKHSRASRS